MKTNHRRRFVAGTITGRDAGYKAFLKSEYGTYVRNQGRAIIRQELRTYDFDPVSRILYRLAGIKGDAKQHVFRPFKG